MLEDMRTRDVQLGQTYLVQVPHRLPPDRYPMHTEDLAMLAEWRQWQLLRGGQFRLTVTALDTAATPPMVEDYGSQPARTCA